jgi:ABC-type multidrug transport system ATPase subunit
MPEIINVKRLSKQFKEVKAVDDLSFSVPQGKIYGFLGQNGAGKSTTIRMLLTLIQPTSGEIEIFGLNLRKNRKEILKRTGAIIEKPDLYKYLTALENLRIFALMSGVKVSEKKLMDQLEKVGLLERAGSKVKTYSQGMKQRLGLATALIHDPDLIILDEPINGLDPQGIADVRNLILHLSRELQKTVFISSHLLSEMELVADHMLIIDKGKKIAEGRFSDLFNPAETIIELETTDAVNASEKIRSSSLKKEFVTVQHDKILFRVNEENVPELVRGLVELDIPVLSIRSKHSLEDYFLSLTTENQHVEAFKN